MYRFNGSFYTKTLCDFLKSKPAPAELLKFLFRCRAVLDVNERNSLVDLLVGALGGVRDVAIITLGYTGHVDILEVVEFLAHQQGGHQAWKWSNRLRYSCKRALEGFHLLNQHLSGLTFRQSVEVRRQKPPRDGPMSCADVLRLSEFCLPPPKREGDVCFRIPDGMSEKKVQDLCYLLVRPVSHLQLCQFFTGKQTPFAPYREEVEDSDDDYDWSYSYDDYGCGGEQVYKRYSLSLQRLATSLTPCLAHEEKAELANRLAGETSDTMGDVECDRKSVPLPWLKAPCMEKEIKKMLEAHASANGDLKSRIEKEFEAYQPPKVMQLSRPLVTDDERRVILGVLEQMLKENKIPDCIGDLLKQTRLENFSKYPSLVLLRYVMDGCDMEIDAGTRWLIFLSSLISATPNDPKVRVAETDYYKTLVNLRNKYLEMMFDLGKPSAAAVVIAASLRNRRAMEYLSQDKDLFRAIVGGALRLFRDVSLLQLGTFRLMKMNELFWVDSGSPDPFNSLWPIASMVQKLLQQVITTYIADAEKTPVADELRELALRFLDIRGTNLRVVLNAVQWMPEDLTVNRTCRETKTPMEEFFPHFQMGVRPLSDETKDALEAQICKARPGNTGMHESDEVFQTQMLAKFGFKLGVEQKAFESGAAKKRNFERFVRTGVSAVASEMCRSKDPMVRVLRPLFFDFSDEKTFGSSNQEHLDRIIRERQERERKKLEELERLRRLEEFRLQEKERLERERQERERLIEAIKRERERQTRLEKELESKKRRELMAKAAEDRLQRAKKAKEAKEAKRRELLARLEQLREEELQLQQELNHAPEQKQDAPQDEEPAQQSKKSRRRRRRRKKKSTACFKCGQEGHLKRDCPN